MGMSMVVMIGMLVRMSYTMVPAVHVDDNRSGGTVLLQLGCLFFLPVLLVFKLSLNLKCGLLKVLQIGFLQRRGLVTAT